MCLILKAIWREKAKLSLIEILWLQDYNISVIAICDMGIFGILIDITKIGVKEELSVMNNEIVRPEYEFEKFVSNLFIELGYEIEDEVQIKDVISNSSYRRADIIVKKEEEVYCVEVKFSRISGKTIEQVYRYISGTDMIPVIVTAYEVKEKEKCI